jgi:DNA-binding XRE family transcriptional regulator
MKDQLMEANPPAQALENFLDEVVALSPTSVDACLEHLRESGAIAGEIDLEPIFELCRLAGMRDVPIVVDEMVGLSEEALTLLRDNRKRVLQEWRALDVRHIAQIERVWSAGENATVHLPVTASAYVTVLCASGELVELMDGWYTRLPPDDGQTPYKSFLPMTVVRTLSVCGPLRVDSLWRGVVRRAKRQNLPIPTLPVFTAFLEHVPGVILAGDAASLDAAVEQPDLVGAAKAIVDCIRGTTRGWASYDELKSAVTRVGLYEGSAMQATMFSPLIMRIGRDRWVIRASEPTEFEGRYDDEFRRRQAEGDVIGRRLRGAREERNLSQQGLADLIGVNQAAISNWERGKHPIPPKHVARLVELFPEFEELTSAVDVDGGGLPRHDLGLDDPEQSEESL